MPDRQLIAHAVLTAAYAVTGAVLALESATAHAACALAAACAYGVLTHAHLRRHGKTHDADDQGTATPS
jgi:hypothetical protein